MICWDQKLEMRKLIKKINKMFCILENNQDAKVADLGFQQRFLEVAVELEEVLLFMIDELIMNT